MLFCWMQHRWDSMLWISFFPKAVNLRNWHSSLNENDATGAVTSVIGAQTTLVGWGAKGIGASWAEYVPFVSAGIDGISTVRDIIETVEDNNGCRSGVTL